MTAQFDDATLAAAAAAGDSAALGLIYDRYGGRLLGLCTSMLRSRADAEDCLQDVFVIAAERLRDLREPALLRSWLFAVARHECLSRLERRGREVPVDEVPDQVAPGGDPSAAAVLDAELAALLRDAAAGLSDRDRLLLELAHRQELTGEELARAIGVPRSTAYTLVDRARATAVRSLGALVVARANDGRCPRLALILAGWDGKLTTLHRKQIARHIDDCEVCDSRRRRLATTAALLGEGQAAVPGFALLKPQILAAAGRSGGPDAVGSAAGARAKSGSKGARAEQWTNGWPPADFRFSTPRGDRHQPQDHGPGSALFPTPDLVPHSQEHHHKLGRGPLTLLLALLILVVLGTIAGALAYQARQKQPASSFAGNPSAATNLTPAPTATLHSPPATPSASPTPAPDRPAPTATIKPRPTQTATATATTTATSTATSSSTPNATIWILTVYTGHGAVSVTINGATSTCLPGHIATPCSYNVPNRQNVDVTAPTSGNAFTAPAACTTTGPDCEFIMTTNTAVRLVGS